MLKIIAAGLVVAGTLVSTVGNASAHDGLAPVVATYGYQPATAVAYSTFRPAYTYAEVYRPAVVVPAPAPVVVPAPVVYRAPVYSAPVYRAPVYRASRAAVRVGIGAVTPFRPYYGVRRPAVFVGF